MLWLWTTCTGGRLPKALQASSTHRERLRSQRSEVDDRDHKGTMSEIAGSLEELQLRSISGAKQESGGSLNDLVTGLSATKAGKTGVGVVVDQSRD